jgi:endoglucanase
MIRFSFFAAVFLLSVCASAASYTTTHGKLKVSEGKILDKNNNVVVLRGMSLFWNIWDDGSKFYTQAVVNSLANNWNTSVVRAAIGDRKVQDAKNMMDWAYNAGIYVIIDNHSHNAHNETDAVKTFFSDVSAYVKQKNYTHVLYEIYNEPVCKSGGSTNCEPAQRTTWAELKTFSQSVISTIRTNDADGLIIVGTPFYSSSITAARLDPLTGTYAHNVLYTLHFYAGLDKDEASSPHNAYKVRVDSAFCKKFPVFVTEWGTSGASGNGTISTSNSNDWISLLEAAKVSHVNWSITDKNEVSAALASNQIEGSLTPSGTYVKNLFKLNTGSSLSSVGLTAKTINCPAPPPERDGKIEFGKAGNVANYASVSGADSIVTGSMAVLENTSKDFTSSYTLYGIPKPGIYVIQFATSSTAGGTVSWSGSGISSGQLDISNNGSLTNYKYGDAHPITISQSPETQLNLSFKTPTAKTLRAAYVRVRMADSADSVNFEIPSSIKPLISSKHWSYNAAMQSFIFEENNNGSLAIYNLRGERKAIYAATGKVFIKNMPSGAYLAVYRNNRETQTKTIYLK